MAETKPGIKSLDKHSYLSLITYRKSGVAVPTPVWFASDSGHLYVYSQANAGKVKRVRRNSKVQVAPCTANGRVLGPCIDAQCRVLPAEEGARVNALLVQKYGILKRIMDVSAWLFRSKRDFLEISEA
jgi:uncharacterized protein